MRMSLEAARSATSGRLTAGSDTPATVEGLSIDSRTVGPGQAFVAIAGERFDGHDHCRAAAEAGAALLVVSRDVGELPATAALLRVDDTRVALGALARAWRDVVDPRVVAITGSMGKTTTKELAAQVCRRLGATHCTRGNFNNEIGLPLTLLAMPAKTRLLVVEMGMNAPGEIARLAAIARPEIGVVTNVAPVHVEGLGSLEAVARAKGELLDSLADAASHGAEDDRSKNDRSKNDRFWNERYWAVTPGDEPLLEPHLAAIPARRRLRFGTGEADEVRILAADPQGERGLDLRLRIGDHARRIALPLVGRHNAHNAAAAAAVGHCLGLPPTEIAAALAEPPAERLGHRSALRRVGGWIVLDDCYNANPRATCAALETIVELAAGGRAVAVLGEMLELGEASAHYHRQVGAHAAGLRLSALVAVGAPAIAEGARAAGMAGERVIVVDDADAAADALLGGPAGAPGEGPRAGGWLLVKGSRGARLEAVLDRLTLAEEGKTTG